MKHLKQIAMAMAFAVSAVSAAAQGYPSRPIRIAVPFAAGSSTDEIARVLSQSLQSEFKLITLIDNKPGAEGMIAAVDVAKAAPDGYTVLMATNTTHAADEHLYKKLPFDPVADFAPVAALCKGYQMALVRASSPLASVADLLASARAKPRTINFGATSASTRVAGEMVKQMAGLDIVYIPYKSNGQALTDLIGGQLDMLFTDASTALAQVRGGKVRALAVTAPRRLAVAPEIPTFDESGLKGYEMSSWTAIYLPRNTPPELVGKLNSMLIKAMQTPGMTQLLDSTGKQLFLSTPDELATFQAAESVKWGKVIRAAGIQAE